MSLTLFCDDSKNDQRFGISLVYMVCLGDGLVVWSNGGLGHFRLFGTKKGIFVWIRLIFKIV